MQPQQQQPAAPVCTGTEARWYLWLWPLAVVLTVCIASSNTIEAPFVPEVVLAPDKLAHLAVFGLIATLLYRALPARLGANLRSLIAIGAVVVFGISDEVHQGFTPGRMFDWYDFVADISGAVIATAAYRWLHPYRRLLEWRLLPARQAAKHPSRVPRSA